jgi:predicted nucleic acid-binding protein
MNVVDSSGWLEYFADDENAAFFADPIEQEDALVVPMIGLYEVFKHVLREAGRDDALRAVAFMKNGRIVALDESLALNAAHISHRHKIPMADSIFLATARAHEATLWTQDADFEGLRTCLARRLLLATSWISRPEASAFAW